MYKLGRNMARNAFPCKILSFHSPLFNCLFIYFSSYKFFINNYKNCAKRSLWYNFKIYETFSKTNANQILSMLTAGYPHV